MTHCSCCKIFNTSIMQIFVQCTGERVLKISQYLAKLRRTLRGIFFRTHNAKVSSDGGWTMDGLTQLCDQVADWQYQTVLCWCRAMLLNSSTSESSLRSGSSSSWKLLSSVVNWWKPMPLRPCDNKLPRFSRRLCRLTPKHGSLPDNRQTSCSQPERKWNVHSQTPSTITCLAYIST